MQQIIPIFINQLKAILSDDLLSVYLYGSCVMDDFQPGWSDIDVLVFTKSPISPAHAESLLHLRQSLMKAHQNPLFRAIEGAVLPFQKYQSPSGCAVVYWGTSGERITNHYDLDPFSRYSVCHFGQCLYGRNLAGTFPCPDFSALQDAVAFHLETIRTYAAQTDESLYSCGWMLDIARCLYTLRHQSIISKTKAGFWALEQHLCPNPAVMEQTLAVRQNALKRKNDPDTIAWLKTLGPFVQRFADVLESELKIVKESRHAKSNFL